MRKICVDQAGIFSLPDLSLNEYRCHRPQYHAFFSEDISLKISSAAPFHHYLHISRRNRIIAR
jgi:hypothetical protein